MGKTFSHEKMCTRFIDFYSSINLPWNFSMHQTSPSPSNVKTHIDTKRWMLRGFNEETFKCNSICGQMEFFLEKKSFMCCNNCKIKSTRIESMEHHQATATSQLMVVDESSKE